MLLLEHRAGYSNWTFDEEAPPLRDALNHEKWAVRLVGATNDHTNPRLVGYIAQQVTN